MSRRVWQFVGIPTLILALMLGSSAMYPWAPMTMMALGATPSSQTVSNVSTTSGTVFVQVGWNRLTCSSDVYYLLVSASTTAVTSATGTLLRGPAGSNGLPKPAWILVSSNQWLALLLKSGTNATCMVETVSLDGSAGSFTTLAVSSTSAFTGQATFSAYTQGQDAGFHNGNFTGTLGATGQTTLSGFLQGQDAGVNNVVATGTANITGATTITGHTNINNDAGVNSLTVAGVAVVTGATTVTGGIDAPTTVGDTCTLNGASPSTCTATVISGSKCVVSNTGTSTNGVKGAVASTTLTVTGPNAATDVVAYICVL